MHMPQGLIVVKEYMGVLKAYLNVGHFIYSFATKHSLLASTTVTSYCFFMHKYLEALYYGLVAFAAAITGHHHHEEEEEKSTHDGQKKARANDANL